MNQGRSKIWWAFWGGVFLVVAALSWASMTVYTLEARSAVSRAMNQRQELIRLALWRMDSRLAPMIALEAARPIGDYETILGEQEKSFGYSYEEAPERSEKKIFEGGLYNRGFFEIDEIGQTKGSGLRAEEIAVRTKDQAASPAESGFDDAYSRNDSSADADDLELISVRSSGSVDALMSSPEPQPKGDYEARQEIANLAQMNRLLSKTANQEKAREVSAGANESKMFSGLVDASDNAFGSSRPVSRASKQASSGVIGAIEPRWVDEGNGSYELVLMRTIERDGGSVVQGVWLDWDAISTELIGSIDDLLPPSTLLPIIDGRIGMGKQASVPSYRLATVPVAFIPGGAMSVQGDGPTPAMMAMLVTWVAVILAMVAVGMVLRTVLTMSARRAHFVGAVTHELRTPLTTFRLYSQMLADGMVTDEAVRKEYLNTLKRESDRLTGIVENVLEYARISRQRYGKDKPKGEQQLSVGELIARIVPPMSRLGEQSGMDLVVSDETGDHAQRTVTLDPHAIERIVMNLMDNACKYAGSDAGGDGGGDGGFDGGLDQESDLRVHLDASVSGDSLLLVVADHGPGVASRDRRKIFGEFVRGSSPEMRDRSGLGLGLALSRGLAVEMGGDLSLVRRRGHGAEFELRIPLDDG